MSVAGTANHGRRAGSGFWTSVRDEVERLLTSTYAPPPGSGLTGGTLAFWSAFDFNEILLDNDDRLTIIFTPAREGPGSYAFIVELDSTLRRWRERTGLDELSSLPEPFAADLVWHMAIHLATVALPEPVAPGYPLVINRGNQLFAPVAGSSGPASATPPRESEP